MPELDALTNARKKDQQDFADVFDEIMDKTDEELAKEARDREASADSDTTGVVTKDQSTENAQVNPDTTDSTDTRTDDDSQQATAVTDPSLDELKAKIETLEADLLKERQRTSSWDGRIRAANKKANALEKENAELKAQLEEQATAKTDEQKMSDQEKMELFRENFPELADFADIMQRRVDEAKAVAASKPAKVESDPAQDFTENQSPAESGQDDHMTKIRSAHNDVDEIVKSGALLTWINSQPVYLQPGLKNLLDSGTASELISMLTEFKTKSGWKSKVRQESTSKEDKLKGMMETGSQGGGPKNLVEPDKNDFASAAKEIGL